MVFVDNMVITNETQIGKNFNKFFTEIDPRLAREIERPIILFGDYLKHCDAKQSDNPVSINELKDAFFPLQRNKSSGYSGIRFNVVKHCFGFSHKPLLYIFIFRTS